jgi:hypothetical protein
MAPERAGAAYAGALAVLAAATVLLTAGAAILVRRRDLRG